MDFGPLGTAITPPQRGGFPQWKYILEDICTVITFMKYKEEIQVIQFNSFLKQRDKIHTAITMRTKAMN